MKSKKGSKISARRNQALNSKVPNRYSATTENSSSRRADTQSTGRKIRETIQRGAYSLGNSVESVGQKLQKNGYSKFGAKVEKVGELIEHMVIRNNIKKATKERNL